MRRDIYIPVGLTIVICIIFMYLSSTISSVLVFIPAMLIALIFYFKTFYIRGLTTDRLIFWYILSVAIQLLHFTEEYLTGFVSKLPALWGGNPYPERYWIVFNMVAYSIFILGGLIIMKRIKELMIIPIFFVIAGVLINGFAHLGLSIFTKGYFPGLITAIPYIFLGPYMIKIITANKAKEIFYID